MSKGGIALLGLFNKIDRIHYSTFHAIATVMAWLDVRCSMFISFFFRSDWTLTRPAAAVPIKL